MGSDIDFDTGTQVFFHSYVTEALATLRLDIGVWTEFYLVDLLHRKAPHIRIDLPLVTQLQLCLAEDAPYSMFKGYQGLGDSALLLLGFFRDNVSNRGINNTYVASMGASAYQRAASLSSRYDGLTEAYRDLSTGFHQFADVLGLVKEVLSECSQKEIEPREGLYFRSILDTDD